MATSYRRCVAFIFIAIVCFWSAASPSIAADAVRKSVNQLTSTEIMSLRRGVSVMMSRNTASRTSADFRRSWVYWANMHAHFGTSCRGPIKGAGMTGVSLWEASNTNEKNTWCKCVHGTDMFAPWHRMYLYYFERVLQQAAGDPNLRLPFWDYATDRKLPLAFREATYVNESGTTVPNPLRVEARKPTLNDGTASLAASATSASNALAALDFTTFRTRIESTPHGTVHCAISSAGCPTGLMGTVPAAALDPIFYLHHANIDRIYDCWLKVDEVGRLPTSSTILNTQYYFVDSDGSVKKRRVGDMLTLSQLGYVYDAGADCPAPAATQMAQATELNRGTTRVPMSVEETGPEQGTARPPAAGREAPIRSATVFIDGVTAAEDPGVLYNVFLSNSAGKLEQIGVIDFFGFDAADPGGGHAGHGGMDMPGDMDMTDDAGDGAAAEPAGRRFSFDVTAAVERLGLRKSARPILSFEPTTGLSNSDPAQVAASISPDAKVSFKRAWLRIDR